DLSCFLAIAAIERRLPAAGLSRVEIDFPSDPLKHRRHGYADLGKQLIHDAGNKQGCSIRHESRILSAPTRNTARYNGISATTKFSPDVSVSDPGPGYRAGCRCGARQTQRR